MAAQGCVSSKTSSVIPGKFLVESGWTPICIQTHLGLDNEGLLGFPSLNFLRFTHCEPGSRHAPQKIPVYLVLLSCAGYDNGYRMPTSWMLLRTKITRTEWYIWVFPKIGVPQNGWFIMENPIKIDDLGVPLFLETPIWYIVQVVVVITNGIYGNIVQWYITRCGECS